MSPKVHHSGNGPKKWLGKDLPLAPYAAQRISIENLYKIKLQHRGEAHITLLTPPEYQSLRTVLSEEDIAKTAADHQIDKASFKEVCIGKFEVKEMSTWFVVIKSDELMAFRKAIANLAEERSSKKNAEIKQKPHFEASNWQPHITLGFTHRDLHKEDGANKDSRSCVPKL